MKEPDIAGLPTKPYVRGGGMPQLTRSQTMLLGDHRPSAWHVIVSVCCT